MRKIAAHYYLRPDSTIGKFPVITFDQKGVITEIREREKFEEEPFMEHANGLLIPGLISGLSLNDCSLNSNELSVLLKKLFIQGHQLVGCPVSHVSLVKSLSPQKLNVAGLVQEDSFYIYPQMLESGNLLDVFHQFLSNKARSWKVDDQYGVLKVGATPGILALSNIGREPYQFSQSSRIKRII